MSSRNARTFKPLFQILESRRVLSSVADLSERPEHGDGTLPSSWTPEAPTAGDVQLNYHGQIGSIIPVSEISSGGYDSEDIWTIEADYLTTRTVNLQIPDLSPNYTVTIDSTETTLSAITNGVAIGSSMFYFEHGGTLTLANAFAAKGPFLPQTFDIRVKIEYNYLPTSRLEPEPYTLSAEILSRQIEPQLLISPSSVDFGTIAADGTSTQTFTVKNVGGAVLSGDVGAVAEPFSVAAGAGAFSLAAGESRDVTVRFDPTNSGTGAFRSSLQVASNSPTPGQSSVSVSLSGKASASVRITTPSSHSPTAVHSNSAYVGLEGTSTPSSANSSRVIYIEARDANQNVINRVAVQADGTGAWDAVVFGGPKLYEIYAYDAVEPGAQDMIHVSAASLGLAHLTVDYSKLHKGDLVISRGKSGAQRRAYGADFTHVSIYVGPNANGTPLITEAIMNDFSLRTFVSGGEVVTRNLDESEAFVDRIKAAIYTMPSITAAQRDSIATFAKAQTGKPYWLREFVDIYNMASMYPFRRQAPFNLFYASKARELNALISSTDTYICSTLARTSYLYATGKDIASPNRTRYDRTSFVGRYGVRFWQELKSKGLLVFPDTIAASGVLMIKVT